MIQLAVAAGRIGREGCGYAMITGQGNGQGGREQGQKTEQLPGGRDINNPEHRKYIAGVWGIEEADMPKRGLSMPRMIEAIHEGKIKGLITICNNPAVSLPDANYVREALGKLEFYVNIDFFLSETARYADIVLPGSLMEEDEGTTTNVEGRVIRHRKAVEPPADARVDWRIVCELATRLGKADKFNYASPRDIFEEIRVASKGGVCDYSGMTWERLDGNYGLFWPCPAIDHPGTPRLYENGQFGHPDGKAHSFQSSGDPRRRCQTMSTRSSSRPDAWSRIFFPARRRGASARNTVFDYSDPRGHHCGDSTLAIDGFHGGAARRQNRYADSGSAWLDGSTGDQRRTAPLCFPLRSRSPAERPGVASS